jgi:hypothetical protein
MDMREQPEAICRCRSLEVVDAAAQARDVRVYSTSKRSTADNEAQKRRRKIEIGIGYLRTRYCN